MQGDKLARGARSAMFPAGTPKQDDAVQLNPGIVSSEPRMEFVPEEINRTRKVKRIVPKGNYILVQRRDSENISLGGIVIPDDSKDKPAEGIILECGPEVKDLKKGDHILFGLYAGTEYPWGAERILFMAEDEVIAAVEE